MGCRKLSYYPGGAFEQPDVFLSVAYEKRVSDEKIGTDYYPFGSVARRVNTPNSYFEGIGQEGKKNFGQYYRYGFNGQFAEEDPETGWGSFQLRMYDAIIGRWLIPDPMNEFWSPYLAFGNNPINLVDPTGGSTNPKPGDLNEAGTQVWGLNANTGEYGWSDVLEGVTFTYEVDAVTAFFDNIWRSQQGASDRSIFGWTPPMPEENKLFGFDVQFYGYEFFNSGDFSGQTVYYVHSGKAYAAIYDPGTAVITFGKLGNKKGFPKGHIPKTSLVNKVKVNVQVFKDMSEVHAKGGNITNSIEKLTTNPISKTMAGEPNKPDSIWVEIEIHNGSRVRIDSMKVKNY